MKIDPERLNSMFQFAGIDKTKLYDALRTMGIKQLKKEMREGWSPDNPTRCFCYVVSEFVYWYVAPNGSIPYSVGVPGDPWIHRYLRWPDGTVVDLTAEQFDNHELVDYNLGKRRMFLQTGCKGPSKRARMLAELMGYDTIIAK
jgi:hypothetical protein